ncbi:MAG: phosphate regulon transcriptional regulatory protein PhoB [Thiotrichales bacterium SG8_50]|nr:MAG: phosphate regulon transcriptional regulatory protein PhoB [Thiotrichales bacterium SG8_50]
MDASVQKRILVVDDEPAIRDMLSFALGREGYAVLEAGDAQEAQTAIADQRPDIVLLDWMLPGVSGIDLARRLRRDDNTRELPIIMLTARDEEDSKIRGLDVGADDYVTKPFSTRELLARIKAVLRRAGAEAAEQVIEYDGLKLDPSSHRVSVSGDAVDMGPTEFRLLQFFMNHPERVYSRGQLLDRVWGGNVYIEERTVDVHIRRLRKALARKGHDRFIQTVRGTGYRFSTQV